MKESPAKPAPYNIALLGNPNSGKSSLFNLLTGLRQKTGNFPGVTVDKKIGALQIGGDKQGLLIDFPGAYSLYPNAQDERIVVQTLLDVNSPNYPDAAIYVADTTKLEKHLLLFSQLKDLGIPLLLALNMADVVAEEGIEINAAQLERQLGAPVVLISGRSGQGLETLRTRLSELLTQPNSFPDTKPFHTLQAVELKVVGVVKSVLAGVNDYQALLVAHHCQWLPFLTDQQRFVIGNAVAESGFQSLHLQVHETMQRYDRFTPIVRNNLRAPETKTDGLTANLDRVLTNRFVGPIIFLSVMLLVFWSIFNWAETPMGWIESGIGALSEALKAALPAGWLTDLLTDGILAGLAGIVVFVPQIAILFLLISILEEVGYMARAAFLFDRLMQFFGLNGRSVVALISSGACAIPAIMSTRTIGNWKERLITIMVTPFISCSARLPVYIVLVGFVVADPGAQALAFMGLYLLGIVGALVAAFVFKLVLKTGESSFLMLELPPYRLPVLRNVGFTVWEKVKTFLLEAGKVILILSIILWALASYSFPGKMKAAEAQARTEAVSIAADSLTTEDLVAERQLEASFAGQLGKAIEPVFRPLGFDWKMSLGILSSFAAREVFVGTMSIIYGLKSKSEADAEAEDYPYLRERLQAETRNGEMVYNRATAASLLIFYVFAMMCMSTLAVVKRETKSWKWPIIQFAFMTGTAYLASFLVYQVLL